MSDIAIKVENLGKLYRIGEKQERYHTFRDTLNNVITAPFRRLRNIGKPIKPDELIWALRDVSFEVKHGEVIGIIGRNGAGKSTLLKILSQITEPTEGQVTIYGRVGSLLEVGTGFHPELTGRENIFLNGAILGMSKAEINRKFDEIVDFAEIERFIDTQVKHYSSGMYMRLAFAVAAHLEPEILLVDEVLAVGDASFQKKCLGKMGDVAKEGRTVLFVSHNMGAIQSLCGRVILLEQGQIETNGNPSSVISKYLSSSKLGIQHYGEVSWLDDANAPGESELKLRSVRLIGLDGEVQSTFEVDKPIRVEIHYEVMQPIRGMRINLYLTTQEGIIAFLSTDHLSQFEQHNKGNYKSVSIIPGGLLNIGVYNIEISADVPGIKRLIGGPQKCLQFTTSGSGNQGSYFSEQWPGVVCPNLKWEVYRES